MITLHCFQVSNHIKVVYFIYKNCNICIEISSFICYDVHCINQVTLYHSEYVAFNDLRVMLLQIGWVGIPTAPAWLPTEMLIKVLQTVSFIGYSIVIPTAPARPSFVFDYLSFV